MNSLGIRVTSEGIIYIVYKSDLKEFIFKIYKRPSFLSLPEFLKYIRYNFLDVLISYKIEYVAIKKIEYNAKNIDFERIAIEGVIQEALASSDILDYYIETKQSLNTINEIGINYKKIMNSSNKFKDSLKEYGDMSNLDMNDEKNKEAVLCSIIAFKKGKNNGK